MKQEKPGGPVRRVTAEEAQDLTGNIFMNRDETAKYLGVKSQTLANNTYNGPSHYKFGGRVLYKLSDVEDWARQQKVERRQGWYPWGDRTFRDNLGPYRTLSVGDVVPTLGDLAGLKRGTRIATNDDLVLTLSDGRHWVDRNGIEHYSDLAAWLPAVIIPPAQAPEIEEDEDVALGSF